MNLLYWLGWSFFRIFFGVIYRVKISGRENVPRSGAFILASNHISYYDPPLVGCCVKREFFFFAKQELFRNKIFGKILHGVNARPVRRGAFDRNAIETAIKVLRNGYALTVFPEGTRTKSGEFLPARPGVGMIARQVGVPIIPVYIQGSNRLWKCFIGKDKLKVIYGKPITVEWVNSFETDKDSYKAISEEIMSRIRDIKEHISIPN